ncbi:MAG: hypothetical protein AAGC85_08650, partial [Bacteroidota bacterium]
MNQGKRSGTSMRAAWLLVCLLSWGTLAAQQPWAYWRFENTSSENQISGAKANIRPYMFKTTPVSEFEPPDPEIKSNPKGEKGYLSFSPETAETIYLERRTFGQGITLEFFFRFDKSQAFDDCRLFYTQDYSIYITMGMRGLLFNTTVKTASGEKVPQHFFIPLDGSDRKSIGYYLDNKWHQMVFKFDALSGKKEIWVDGKLADGFSTVHEVKGETICASNNCVGQLVFNFQKSSGYRFIGDVDEVVIYDQFIDEDIHIQHLYQFWENEPFAFKFSRSQYGDRVLKIKEISTRKLKSTNLQLTYEPTEYPNGL